LVKLNFYVAGNSVIHRLYPLTKILILIDFLIISFTFYNPIPSILLILVGFFMAVIAGKKVVKAVLGALVLILPAVAAIMTFQTFFEITFPSRPVAVGPFIIHIGGIYWGGLVASRILFAIVAGVTLIVTMHPGDLFTAMRRIRLPYMLGFMTMTMLQYVPILLTEAGIISQAQQSRGIKQSGFGAILPSFVPLFVISWQRAQTLSMALEIRGLGSPGQKTSFRRTRAGPLDFVVGAVVTAITAYLVYFGFMNSFLDWKATYYMAPMVGLAIGLVSLIGFFITMGTAVIAYRA
jgi:energy-coupling factor transport system permease protein